MSSEMAPVGITSSGTRTSSPSRITEPLPNCLSMLASATSSALSRLFAAAAAMVIVPHVCLVRRPAPV